MAWLALLGVLYESGQPLVAGTSLCLWILWHVGLRGSRVPGGRKANHRRTVDFRQGLAAELARSRWHIRKRKMKATAGTMTMTTTKISTSRRSMHRCAKIATRCCTRARPSSFSTSFWTSPSRIRHQPHRATDANQTCQFPCGDIRTDHGHQLVRIPSADQISSLPPRLITSTRD